MGQLIFFNMMSLDGFFEGKNKELDWHNLDGEFNKFAIEQLNSAGYLIFGRNTYELMAKYWPTNQAISNDPKIAEKMNEIKKIVFSTSLDKAHWQNTTIFRNDITKVVSELKKSSDKNVLILGSANLSETLIKNGLIDLYRIMVNPIILGNGRLLFADITKRIGLKLTNVKSFKSGNVLMEYQPK